MVQSNINTGKNINQIIDISKVVIEFITYFYTNLLGNPNVLITSGALRDFTTLKFKGVKYTGTELLQALNYIKTLIAPIGGYHSYEFIDCGSRRIDIIVNFKKDTNIFVQHFTLCFNKKWYIKNSMFIII